MPTEANETNPTPDRFAAISEDDDDDKGEWLTTYADMVTLLMTFFVMLVAISSMNTARFKDIMTSIQYTMGASSAAGGRIGRIDSHDVKRMSLSEMSGLENEPILKDIRQTINMKNLDDVLNVAVVGNQIIIDVKGQVLFPEGNNDFGPRAKEVLAEIAKLARNYPDWRLDVKGHTDPRPISNEKYASNWELSALRATSVLRYLLEEGVNPRRLTATGYADTEPLVPNTSEENMARNRRVEFVLEKKEE